MAQVRQYIQITNPVAGTLYTLYAVPANATLYITGAEIQLQNGSGVEEVGMYNLTQGLFFMLGGGPSDSRDYTSPVIANPGDIIQFQYTGGAITPTEMIGILVGYTML